MWDSLADLQETMQSRGKGEDNEVEVQKIVKHLSTNMIEPARSKRKDQLASERIDPLLVGLIDGMQQAWEEANFLGQAAQAQESVKTAIEAHERARAQSWKRVARRGE